MVLLVFIAPFFVYIFPALLKTNINLAALIGGAYLGAIFNGGVGAIEAYIEKVSHANGFECGRVRVFGNIGAATSTFVTGHLFNTNPNLIFWISSALAVLLAVVFAFARLDSSKTPEAISNQDPKPKASTDRNVSVKKSIPGKKLLCAGAVFL